MFLLKRPSHSQFENLSYKIMVTFEPKYKFRQDRWLGHLKYGCDG